MGTLRFFLAISIIVAHAGPEFGLWLVDPRLAVQMFYLMSGFSMAFVWHEKYAASPSPYRTFFIGRTLRIMGGSPGHRVHSARVILGFVKPVISPGAGWGSLKR